MGYIFLFLDLVNEKLKRSGRACNLFAKQSRPGYWGKNDFQVVAKIKPERGEGKAENFLVREAGREEWCTVQWAAIVIFGFPRSPIEQEPK